MTPCSFARSFVVLFTLAAAGLRAQTSSPLDDVISLPEFQVISERPLPPREDWSYVRLGNFEVLSSTSDRITKEFVKDLHDFQIVLSAVSRHMLIQAELPVMVVLCGKGSQFERFAVKSATPSMSGRGTSLVRDNEIASILVDYHARAFGEEIAIMESFGRNFRGDLPLVGRREIHTSEEFVRQYVHLSFSQITPRLPAWAAEGMANIYSDIEYNNKWIQVGLPKSFRNEYVVESPLLNYNDRSSGLSDFSYERYGQDSTVGYNDFGGAPRVYVAPLYIMPFEQMFAVNYNSPRFTSGGNVQLDGWRKQTTAFVHMCLYGRNGRYRQGFLKFTARAAEQPVTEALFKQCFGKSYKDMAFELRSYTEFTDYKSTVYKAPKGENILRPAPRIEIRPATDGEIGRILGETFRLAGQDEAARNEFVVAYLRGDRDPQLLGSLGLMARQRGDQPRAKTYLEAVAVAPATIPRPRAYLELARLRLAQHQAANGKRPLDVQQLASVLTPLFAAQKLPQQLVEIYLEIARAWENTSVEPDRGNIAALEHGIRIFPRNGRLVVATAGLLIKHGYKSEATPLILRTLNATRDPELKRALEKLRQQIDAAPGARIGSALRFSPEVSLPPELRQRLADYRAAKAAATVELRTRLAGTENLPPVQRERELAAFAAMQTPKLRALESDAARLERDLGWSPDEGEDYGLGLADAGGRDAGAAGNELAMLHGALARPQGLSPPQIGLLREMIMEAQDGAATRGAFLFFSPATARVRIGAGLDAGIAEQIAGYSRDKAALKQELHGLLETSMSTAQSDIARTVSLSALAQDQAPRFDALENLAESIRRSLAQFPASGAAPAVALPPDLAGRLLAYQQERGALQREARRDLRALRSQAPAEVEVVAVGEPSQLSLKTTGRTSAAALAPPRAAIEAFNRHYAERFGALDRELTLLRGAIARHARLAPTAPGKSVDDLMRDFAGAALRQTSGEAYRDYRAAVFQPGLSPEQRRLLFARMSDQQLILEF